MASIHRNERGSYVAQWYRRNGTVTREATGEYEYERALKEAQRRESVCRFWEDHHDGLWQVYANLGFSPKYCHDNFTHAKHMRFDAFRALLNEASIKFKPPAQFRDRPKRATANGKRYTFRGKKMTIAEIITTTSAQITAAALRWRLDRGWQIEQAVTTPLLSRAEAGRQGADKTNTTRSAARRGSGGGGGASGPSPSAPHAAAKTAKEA